MIHLIDTFSVNIMFKMHNSGWSKTKIQVLFQRGHHKKVNITKVTVEVVDCGKEGENPAFISIQCLPCVRHQQLYRLQLRLPTSRVL